MSARSPAADFRHLRLWPAIGARYGNGALGPVTPARPASQTTEKPPEASPRVRGLLARGLECPICRRWPAPDERGKLP
jgi:hypothetical protein